MKSPILFFLICPIIFASCDSLGTRSKNVAESGGEVEFVPLSNFTIDSTAIAPGTPVRLLGISGSKDFDKDAIYYSQIIVVNEKNGDTLSILCPAISVPGAESPKGVLMTPGQLDPEKGVREAIYEKQDPNDLLVMGMAGLTESELNDTATYDINKLQKKQLVAINKTLSLFSRKYKTVIGILKFASNVSLGN